MPLLTDIYSKARRVQ